ncbi:MAG: hypothetical protein GEU95_02495 [Rhizobiales bacterium]|nr:hypothetical protein [Hyphomicrobiales bacterium]
MLKRIQEWYRGPYVTPPPNDPRSSLVFITGHHKPHWTARAAQALVGFWLAHWQWIIGTTIACAGLMLAYSKL